MTVKASVFIATSLDGYISRLDGSIDWLNEANAAVPPGEDCGYAQFMSTVDIIVMGRHTFEQVLTFDPWPFDGKRLVVLSSRPLAIPSQLASSVSASSESPAALIGRLSSEGGRTHLYIDGGKTIQGFLQAGLVDDITVTTIPVLLGAGRPLFGVLPRDMKLSLVSSKAYPFGFVQSTYRVGSATETA